MITRIINGKLYELVASASDGKWCFLSDEIAREIKDELHLDFILACSGWPKIKTGIKLARFFYYDWGFRVSACTEYRSVLDEILKEELKYKHPRYKQLAMECAHAIAYRLYESDCEIDQDVIAKVNDFYKSFYCRRK